MTDNLPPVDTVMIDGRLVPILSKDIQFSDLARFQPKILFGDPSKDDNDLLSSWQMGDWTAGNGVFDLKEGTDQGRYNIGTLYTRYPYMLSRPPGATQAQSLGGINKVYEPLGEFWNTTNNRIEVVYRAGLNVRRALTTNDVGEFLASYETAGGSSGNLPDAPVNKGQAFQGTFTEERFFIPRGNNGYSYITGTSAAPTNNASPKFTAFAVWDNKLIGITTGGRMYWSLDGSTFTAYDLTFQLSKSYRIRNLVNFFDRRDEPALFVITDRDLWQFDPAGPELFRIDQGWPSHPYHGRASCTWNGQLYVAVGMAVFRYSGGAWMPVGLDRDDGIPAEYAGRDARIVDMVPGWNSLYALVQGGSGDSYYGGHSSIFEYTGTGWHILWTQPDVGSPASIQYHGAAGQTASPVNRLLISQSGDRQTLYFGLDLDADLWAIQLGLNFANPRVGIRTGQGWFDAANNYYYLETGRFDADMFGYVKVANAVQYVIEEPLVPTFTRDKLRIAYRVDDGPWQDLTGWKDMIAGRYVALFGDPDDRGIYPGMPFESIQLRFEIDSGTDTARPGLLTNTALSFVKTVNSNHAFTLRVPILPAGYGDLAGPEIQDFLDGLIDEKRFVQLKIGDHAWRVMMTQNGGTRRSGTQDVAGTGTRTIAFVEIPAGFSG